MELAQRLSTVAAAVNSFEMAMAVQASLPTAALTNLGVGAGYTRAAQGNIEAYERLPRVVGFSDRQENGNKAPHFGWVFGPRAVVVADEQALELHQTLSSYALTADLSIPGWWPRVQMELETAWISNWRNKADVFGSGVTARRSFNVTLPTNRADMDGLTEVLAFRTIGGGLPFTRITNVSPDKIGACEDEVELLVYGQNVWRSTEAFLNGRRHKDLRILPNMAGVAVTFDIENLPVINATGSHDRADLTLWTRNGPSSHEIELVDARRNGLQCLTAVSASVADLRLRPKSPRLVLVSNRLTAGLDVTAGRLPPGFHNIVLGLRRLGDRETLPGKDTASVTPDDLEIEQTFEIDTARDKAFAKDGLVQLSATINLREKAAAPLLLAVADPIAYYKAKPQFVIEDSSYKLGNDLALQLPENHRYGFPELAQTRFNKGQVPITASLDGKPEKYTFAVNLVNYPPRDKRDLTISLTLAKGELEELKNETSPKLTLKIRFADGSVEEIKKLNLTMP